MSAQGGSVVKLGGGDIKADASVEFHHILGNWIDKFTQSNSHSPQGLVFVLTDAEGNAMPSWLMREDLEGQATGQIAIASILLGKAMLDG